MARKKTKAYPESFRKEAVKMADLPDRTAADVARELGIHVVVHPNNNLLVIYSIESKYDKTIQVIQPDLFIRRAASLCSALLCSALYNKAG